MSDLSNLLKPEFENWQGAVLNFNGVQYPLALEGDYEGEVVVDLRSGQTRLKPIQGVELNYDGRTAYLNGQAVNGLVNAVKLHPKDVVRTYLDRTATKVESLDQIQEGDFVAVIGLESWGFFEDFGHGIYIDEVQKIVAADNTEVQYNTTATFIGNLRKNGEVECSGMSLQNVPRKVTDRLVAQGDVYIFGTDSPLYEIISKVATDNPEKIREMGITSLMHNHTIAKVEYNPFFRR